MVNTTLEPGPIVDDWGEHLASLGPYYGPVAENDVIDRLSSDFGDGYEGVLFLTNHIAGPFVLPILFFEGVEQQRLDGRRVLLGDYVFAHDDHDFMLTVA